ncbi:FixH family protein [Caldifermentibacillus hisashii]|uniref:FixH family protein n=1 Tax=Caldifermentibacillus hisashii TaxID=996558 RepID=UPI0031014869
MKEKLHYLTIILILFSFLLTACNDSTKKTTNEEEIPELVEVDLQVPEKAEVGEKILIKAHVTQGNEEVDDADEVVFEIWKNGSKDESQMLDFTKQEKGNYQLETTFDSSGVYYIQVHVTARRMHVMPKQQIIIGDVDPNEITTTEETDHHDHH